MAAMVLGQVVAEMEMRPSERRAAGMVQRNLELLDKQRARRRGPTPEVFFAKHIDNSRLEKQDDPERKREMWRFAATVVLLAGLTGAYVLQHFWAIEMGYRVEAQKQSVEQLREENRQLRLTEAELSDPGRLDAIARQLGMAQPLPGQVVRQEAPLSGAPVLAEVQRLVTSDK